MNTKDYRLFSDMLTVLSEEHFYKPYTDSNLMGQECYKSILRLCESHGINAYRFMNNYMFYLKDQRRKSLTLRLLSPTYIDNFVNIYNKYYQVAGVQPPLNFYNNFLLRSFWKYFMYQDINIEAVRQHQLSELLVSPLSHDEQYLRSSLLQQGVSPIVVFILIKGLNKLDPLVTLYDNDVYDFISKFNHIPNRLLNGIQHTGISISTVTYNAYCNTHEVLTTCN